MGTFKLVAFDLDGTLFGANQQVSGQTIAVLRRVAARGVHLVAATGRSHLSAGPLLAPTQAIDWAVCSNGATFYHVPANRVTGQFPIPAEHVDALTDCLGEVLPGCVFAWESMNGHGWTKAFASVTDYPIKPDQVVGDDQPRPSDIVKFFINHPGLDAYGLLRHLQAEADCPLNITTSGVGFVEATAAGVNKATSLARLCQQLQVERDETVAFGDNLNDLEMLSWAGRGYAMANAHHEVVAATGYRTRLPNTHDGVADTLAELFLG